MDKSNSYNMRMNFEKNITSRISYVNNNYYKLFDVDRNEYSKLINDLINEKSDSSNATKPGIRLLNKENIEDGTKRSVDVNVTERLEGYISGDDACHIIAKSLGGTNCQFTNLFAGTKRLNRDIMKHVEVVTRDYIRHKDINDQVFYKVDVIRGNITKRVKKVKIIVIPLDERVSTFGIEIKNID